MEAAQLAESAASSTAPLGEAGPLIGLTCHRPLAPTKSLASPMASDSAAKVVQPRAAGAPLHSAVPPRAVAPNAKQSCSAIGRACIGPAEGKLSNRMS